MRLVDSFFLAAIGANLLLGCVPLALAANSSSSRTFQYASGTTAQDSLSIAFLPNDVELHPSTAMSVVILDPSNASNIAFCRALLGRNNSLSSFLPQNLSVQDVRTFVWFENRASVEFGNIDTTSSACRARLDNFHFDRARSLAQDFDLNGSEGPWLLSVDPLTEKAVLLDFSGYAAADYDEEISKWQKHIANNDNFWSETQSENLATIFLITEYLPEYTSGHLRYHSKK
jgi:hypothetical protein